MNCVEKIKRLKNRLSFILIYIHKHFCRLDLKKTYGTGNLKIYIYRLNKSKLDVLPKAQ